ncbi:uncharacterized protein LOC118756230 [Rhagoletis pomonella]|uniref:uncharacterized protein LOC118756230 n=1 Tax=Rhagoletis pomonella TaxID=28610 RepID=UPI00177DB290|nr:uncharacterized protein LOC118756230 [Rhagoletis pomonella]
MLGVKHLRTTAYHPQSNGVIERWHRTLKSAIKCYASNDWSFVLPLVLLGLRSTTKEDIGASATDVVSGAPIRLPGELLQSSTRSTSEVEFAEKLRTAMQALRPAPTSHHITPATFVQTEFKEAAFVFVRVDRVKSPLEASYEGPFEVVERGEKYYKIKMFH